MKEKLIILKEAGKINQSTQTFVLHTFEHVRGRFELDEDNEVLNTAMTHLAMAVARQSGGESVEAMNEELFSQIKENDAYRESKRLWEEIRESSPLTFTPSEEQYMLLHLCNVINQK